MATKVLPSQRQFKQFEEQVILGQVGPAGGRSAGCPADAAARGRAGDDGVPRSRVLPQRRRDHGGSRAPQRVPHPPGTDRGGVAGDPAARGPRRAAGEAALSVEDPGGVRVAHRESGDPDHAHVRGGDEHAGHRDGLRRSVVRARGVAHHGVADHRAFERGPGAVSHHRPVWPRRAVLDFGPHRRQEGPAARGAGVSRHRCSRCPTATRA